MISHLDNLFEHAQKGGLRGGLWWFRKLWYRKVPDQVEDENVFDRDWDLLIILDGCDPSWFNDLSDEFSWLPSYEEQNTLMSVGSTSFEWYPKTFNHPSSETLSETAVISSNVFAGEYVPNQIGKLDDLTKWGWDDTVDIVPAHTVTDAAVDIGRRTDFDRYLVHYMQPHYPFLERGQRRTDITTRTDWSSCWEAWYAVMRGEATSNELEALYRENLEYVLPEVQSLLENFDAETAIITSDHSNAVGQQGMYGHPGYVEMPLLREVPWIQTCATDTQSLQPDIDRGETADAKRQDQLEALGYV
jgi:hypothetical protein